MKANSIAMAGGAIALENELRNAARIKELERQLEDERARHAAHESAYLDKVIALLAQFPYQEGMPVVSSPEIDMGSVNLAAYRIRSYLAARADDTPARDIISIHADSACILNASDLARVLTALPRLPAVDNDLLKQVLARLAARPVANRSEGAVTWVTCPVCQEPDMRSTADEDGNVLINCVNHGCLSNGGPMRA